MRMADAKLKVAKRIYEAKMRRLDTTADTVRGAAVAVPHDGVRVERSPTHTLQVREDRTGEESRSERLQVEVFGARERATASPPAARQHMRLVVPLCGIVLSPKAHLERI